MILLSVIFAIAAILAKMKPTGDHEKLGKQLIFVVF